MTVKIVVLGSLEHGDYEVLAPHKIDPELYETDHEKAYEKAKEVFYPAIDESTFIVVFQPKGLGGHTETDREYAVSQGKPIVYYPPLRPEPIKTKWLSSDDWRKLDDLLGKHGFGGYYDLIESLKIALGDLGIERTGVDLYPEGVNRLNLPETVRLLTDWTFTLSRHPEWSRIIEEKAKEVRDR